MNPAAPPREPLLISCLDFRAGIRRWRWFVPPWLGLVMAVGCVDKKVPETVAETPEADSEPAPEQRLARVHGRLLAAGHALGGIKIETEEQEATTDNWGRFSFEIPVEQPTEIALVVHDHRYAATQKVVTAVPDEDHHVTITTLAMQTLGFMNVPSTSSLEKETLKLVVKGPVLKTPQGSTATGWVEVKYALLSEPLEAAVAPNSLVAGPENRQEVGLESYGVVALEFLQDGAALQLDGPIELTYQLGSSPFEAGEKVPVWSLGSNQWVSKGAATIEKAENGAKVAHFTVDEGRWWTVARSITAQTCVSGQLIGPDGPVTGVSVDLTGMESITTAQALSDADGKFCTAAKRNSIFRLSAFADSEQELLAWKTTAATATTKASCDTNREACLNLGKLQGAPLYSACPDSETNEDHTMLLSSGLDDELDEEVRAVLEAAGPEVTVGPSYGRLDGTADLSAFNTVFAQPEVNWEDSEIKDAGARQLVQWVHCGGGLVTVEPVVWSVATAIESPLQDILPATLQLSSLDPNVYIQVGHDPSFHRGIPPFFSVPADRYLDGANSFLQPRAGATVFYGAASAAHGGAVGWEIGKGRVVSLAARITSEQLKDENYARLLRNALTWASGKTPDREAEPKGDDDSCRIDLPNSECDPLARCGCESGERCLWYNEQAVCVSMGTTAVGARCQDDAECETGLCAFAICADYCPVDMSCFTGQECYAFTPPIAVCFNRCDLETGTGCENGQVCGGSGYCVYPQSPCPAAYQGNGLCDGPSGLAFCAKDEEDPLDCLACASPVPGARCDPLQQCGCPEGLHCQLAVDELDLTVSASCVVPGPGEAGESCARDSDCGTGLGCLMGRCAAYCDPKAEDVCEGCREIIPGLGLCHEVCEFPEVGMCRDRLVCTVLDVCAVPLNPCPDSFQHDDECDGPSGTRLCAEDGLDSDDCTM